ncbi:ParE family toxin-like protein [Rhizobium herbae]
MKNHATTAFWQTYDALPTHVRELADRNFEKLKTEPKHPSLHFKQAGRFWSVRVGASWHALAVRQNDDMVWFWIGSHAEYDKLLK